MNAAQFNRKRAAIDRRARGRAWFVRKAVAHLMRDAGAVPVVAGGRVVGFQMPDGSVACSKQRYRDDVSAQLELARIARHASHGYVPVRAYRCEFCAGFHLTSRP